ncbi:agglutinin-2-like [Salvia miltiorrhiza]|uniref:agglutinin-2-like n=1 Tax=Salvia miltiorrhiza TaxID=226208 RepID=UPI0025ABD853|nr:agglutinin-2-like [Salvia miltiorrhiza]
MASHSLLKTSPTTTFTYDFYGSKPTDPIYQGDAHFPTDTTYLRLTKTDSSGSPVQSSFGRILHPEPVLLWKPSEQANFNTTVKFVLKPRAGNNIPADGLVFFMVPVDYTFPSYTHGGNLGIFGGPDGPKVFAVEFDIFVNGEWDPNFPHVGINIETRASQKVAQIPESFIGKEVTLKITYAAATGLISAFVTAGPQTVEVSHVCDLSGVLPQQVQVGLAGSTGEYVAKHDVAYWEFNSALVKNGA